MTVHIMRGPSGAGKSTYVKMHRKSNDVIVSRDLFRQSFGLTGGGVLSTEQERFVTSMEMDILRRAVRDGRDVWVDNTNLDTRRASAYATEAHILGVEFEEINLYEAGSDDLYVGRSDIPENVVLRQVRSAKKMTPLEPRVELIKPYSVEFPPVEECFVFDIDGTLSYSEGLRSPYDYSRVQYDYIYYDVVTIANILSDAGYHIFIVSGRDEECRKQTEKWLDEVAGVDYDDLLMRKHGDTRHDAQVKYEIAWSQILPNYWISGIFDDRTRVVSMWRSMGFRTYQVKGHFESDF